MRAFISLNLSDETIAILKDFQKSIKDTMGFGESKKVKWESPDKFHITMFFIGDIGDNKIEYIKNDLKTIQDENIGAIPLELLKLNAFPNLQNPRVLFIEVLEKCDKLNKLSDSVNKIMKFNGYEQNGKFHPHITLGRIRRNAKLLKVNKSNIIINGDFIIRKLFLMKSVLNREGSKYESVFFVEL